MTREELMEKAVHDAAYVSDKAKNRIMNIVNQAWCEGSRSAEEAFIAEYNKRSPNHYQKLALRTANLSNQPYGDLTIGALGLAGESGEVADHVKKFLGQGHELDRDHIIEECGDVLWYVALTLHSVGCTMEDCMQRNVEKLKKRYPNGFEAERSLHRDGVSYDLR